MDEIGRILASPASPLWLVAMLVAAAVVRAWPAIMQRTNEARKHRMDADAGLRGDLLDRIKDLEQQQAHGQQRLDSALAEERRRCDAEMATMRLDFQKQVDGIMRQFLAFQVAVAQSAPPLARSSDIDSALDSLRGRLGKESGE